MDVDYWFGALEIQKDTHSHPKHKEQGVFGLAKWV